MFDYRLNKKYLIFYVLCFSKNKRNFAAQISNNYADRQTGYR
jgi:hypothetical protein